MSHLRHTRLARSLAAAGFAAAMLAVPSAPAQAAPTGRCDEPTRICDLRLYPKPKFVIDPEECPQCSPLRLTKDLLISVNPADLGRVAQGAITGGR